MQREKGGDKKGEESVRRESVVINSDIHPILPTMYHNSRMTHKQSSGYFPAEAVGKRMENYLLPIAR